MQMCQLSPHIDALTPLKLDSTHVARGMILHPVMHGAETSCTGLCKEVSKYCKNKGEALRCHALLLHSQHRIQGAAPTEPSCSGHSCQATSPMTHTAEDYRSVHIQKRLIDHFLRPGSTHMHGCRTRRSVYPPSVNHVPAIHVVTWHHNSLICKE